MTVNIHDRNAREFLRARLLGRREELARLGALVQGDRLMTRSWLISTKPSASRMPGS